jgi:hypothetical protein
MIAAPFSAIMIVGAFVLVEVTAGIRGVDDAETFSHHVAPARRSATTKCREQHAMPCHDASGEARGAWIDAAALLRTASSGWFPRRGRSSAATLGAR